MTGTSVSSPTRVIPCVTAALMYSKCIVSPLTRTPTQTTARTDGSLQMAFFAANGSS